MENNLTKEIDDMQAAYMRELALDRISNNLERIIRELDQLKAELNHCKTEITESEVTHA